MNALKRLVGHTKTYRFIEWLYTNFMEEQKKIYRPDQFREYGKGIRIKRNVSINAPDRVILKDRCCIHSGTVINSLGGLYVGENTGIGYNCTIFTVQHNYRNAKKIPFDHIGDLKPVIIREYVWIGEGVKILPGIEIGEGAIIGMGAVVTKNVPKLAIVMGNPCEIIGHRSEKHYYRCKEQEQFCYICSQDNPEVTELRVPRMMKVKYEKELKALGLI